MLEIPTGGATLAGLEHNIAVGVLFIYSWITLGQGSFEFKGFVEDSATAEISRSQASVSGKIHEWREYQGTFTTYHIKLLFDPLLQFRNMALAITK